MLEPVGARQLREPPGDASHPNSHDPVLHDYHDVTLPHPKREKSDGTSSETPEIGEVDDEK